jgi:hypothetical protein
MFQIILNKYKSIFSTTKRFAYFILPFAYFIHQNCTIYRELIVAKQVFLFVDFFQQKLLLFTN